MGFKIVKKEKLNSVTTLFKIEAALIAEEAKAGQFIVLRIGERSERIPLTVVKKDPKKGIITIIFQEAGKTTQELALLKEGDSISDLIGPLGKETDFGKAGRVVFVGGGVGVAEILPVIEYAKSKGNEILAIIGARSGELIILEEDLRKFVPELIVTTDDGSYGRKGLVTLPLEEILKKGSIDLVYCVGPDIMMKVVSEFTKKYGVKTLVSLDANMVDATGMCGTCRVKVGGEVKFTCVDGPEFNGHLV
ncbi:MAG: sulfide/dihydroorotate dehydrogenase-like FAD/NAD-binding protein, partial [Candidatus Omnitrophica bacterium]|nr:sulfide/dihydroorotate dehydrogenase-like FAD/NAD-binding protein [Candidatus Omnitrophota bacterium]